MATELKSGLQDGGERKNFDTGAMREVSDGRGRCDLLPLDAVALLCTEENGRVLKAIERFKSGKNIKTLVYAIAVFATNEDVDIYTLMLEQSKHFEADARKYSENNWKKGIPLHCYLDSAVRHLLKHLRGDTDEPHDRAVVWNLLCAIWTCSHKPELDDVEIDI